MMRILGTSRKQLESLRQSVKECVAQLDKQEAELALLRAAYKDVLTADQLRNALRGADQTDLFKAVLQVAAGMREQAILQGGGPGESADGRAFTDGEVNALDRLKRDLVARVQAANRD